MFEVKLWLWYPKSSKQLGQVLVSKVNVLEEGVQGRFKVCFWVVTIYGKVDDNQGLLGTWLACCHPLNT
jgi:hypothetical protein